MRPTLQQTRRVHGVKALWRERSMVRRLHGMSDPWKARADSQNFLYNNALRFCLEGSWIFLNLKLSGNKELEIGKGLAYSERYTCVYIIKI